LWNAGLFSRKIELFLFERRSKASIVMLTHLTQGFSMAYRALFAEYRALFTKNRALSLGALIKGIDDDYTSNTGLFTQNTGLFPQNTGLFSWNIGLLS